jgi:hypothetical protein
MDEKVIYYTIQDNIVGEERKRFLYLLPNEMHPKTENDHADFYIDFAHTQGWQYLKPDDFFAERKSRLKEHIKYQDNIKKIKCPNQTVMFENGVKGDVTHVYGLTVCSFQKQNHRYFLPDHSEIICVIGEINWGYDDKDSPATASLLLSTPNDDNDIVANTLELRNVDINSPIVSLPLKVTGVKYFYNHHEGMFMAIFKKGDSCIWIYENGSVSSYTPNIVKFDSEQFVWENNIRNQVSVYVYGLEAYKNFLNHNI